MTLEEREKELKKRWEFPYKWGQKQNNRDDNATRFVYDVFYYDELIEVMKQKLKKRQNKEHLFNYGLNRWYNFWSADAVETIFNLLPNVQPIRNMRDFRADFKIQGIRFDHKTTVFPNGYKNSLSSAKTNPESLVKWLYLHQSTEQREHYKNRLFIVMYSEYKKHWKLKSEICWLNELIHRYIESVKVENIPRYSIGNHKGVVSDIIWAVK